MILNLMIRYFLGGLHAFFIYMFLIANNFQEKIYFFLSSSFFVPVKLRFHALDLS